MKSRAVIELERIGGQPAHNRRFRLLPPDSDEPPSTRQRILFIVTVLLPWVALYEFTAWLRLPGTAFRFGFEDSLPVYPWTGLIYQSIYPVVAAAPWLARTQRDLRRLTISAWLAEALVFPFYWLVPSTAPRRAMDAESWIGRLLAWERDGIPPTAAFPSFHMLWAIFVARAIRPAWLGVLYATAIAVSCITTGMHYIPDLLGSLAIAPLLVKPGALIAALRRYL